MQVCNVDDRSLMDEADLSGNPSNISQRALSALRCGVLPEQKLWRSAHAMRNSSVMSWHRFSFRTSLRLFLVVRSAPRRVNTVRIGMMDKAVWYMLTRRVMLKF
jgi:hypothetical protein